MLKKHVIAIEQIDGNASTFCDKPSDIDMNESSASFTNAFQTGNVTLSSSMNESLSPSIDTSTTNKPKQTNKNPQIRINNEFDGGRSKESSLGETAKEPKTTPRRTTTPKRRHSFSSPSANSRDLPWEEIIEILEPCRQRATGRRREEMDKALIYWKKRAKERSKKCLISRAKQPTPSPSTSPSSSSFLWSPTLISLS